MSQENVEAILGVLEEADAGEVATRFDALLDPAVQFRDEFVTLTGRDAVRDYIEGFRQSFGGFHVEVRDVRDLGETLVIRMNQGGEGAVSGAAVEQLFTWVFDFDAGRCVRWHIYADHRQALEAAGLSE